MSRMEFTPDGKHVYLMFGNQIGYWDTRKKTIPTAGIGGTVISSFTVGPNFRHAILFRKDDNNNRDPKMFGIMEYSGLDPVNGDTLGFKPPSNLSYFRHTSVVQLAAMSQDGFKLATVTKDRAISLWNIPTRKKTAVCKGHRTTPLSISFSPDGKLLASADKSGTIRLWHVPTGDRVAVLKGHRGPVRSVAFDPRSRILASGGDDNTIILWDVKTAKQLAVLKGHTGAVLNVAFSRDGRLLASASKDKTVRMWEPR